MAEAIGGRVEYVLRNVEMTIDEYSFLAPVAWLQTGTGGEQLLLGREVVFDKFDIEFRQADEKILFKWREDCLQFPSCQQSKRFDRLPTE
ncbi:hypothetical protein [Scytonema sp. UIC 10036]|uniref:hypothetical protein n=1 Tax=Scytonema sp. UIC 10036 TaxID=2304196 RepID=UPI00140F8595|nr:hypothetical protein [Scytonema sp. UIC 10036]